jgi:hypothetical protein
MMVAVVFIAQISCGVPKPFAVDRKRPSERSRPLVGEDLRRRRKRLCQPSHIFGFFRKKALARTIQGGKSVGLAADIIRAAAVRAGIDALFVPVTIEQQMPSLSECRADALYTGITPERSQLLDFGAPVLMTGGALYVRAPNPTPESSSIVRYALATGPALQTDSRAFFAVVVARHSCQ